MIDKLLELLPIVGCKQATRLASLQMERRLSLKETIDLYLHLAVCSLCKNFTHQIAGLRRTLRQYHPNKEKLLSSQAKEQLKTTLKNQGI